jgi:phosphatidylglycerol---prolipoprotein diacylglyceryl transferase
VLAMQEGPLSIDSYAIRIGPIAIHFYALILMSGMLVAAYLTTRRARQYGLDPEHVWNGLMWAIIPGLIGARIYHILTPSPASGLSIQHYLEHPLEMFAIWNGGLGIYGGLLGGALGILYYSRRHRQPLLKWFDVIAPTVLVAQAIGRWGNFVNQELYGAPTDLPWGIYIDFNKRVEGYKQFERFHPLFLYESLLNLLGFGILIYVERRYRERLRDGDLLLMYFMLYPIIRFVLDFVRLDSNGFGPLTTAQVVSMLVFLAALATLLIRHRSPVVADAKRVKASQKGR